MGTKALLIAKDQLKNKCGKMVKEKGWKKLSK